MKVSQQQTFSKSKASIRELLKQKAKGGKKSETKHVDKLSDIQWNSRGNESNKTKAMTY